MHSKARVSEGSPIKVALTSHPHRTSVRSSPQNNCCLLQQLPSPSQQDPFCSLVTNLLIGSVPHFRGSPQSCTRRLLPISSTLIHFPTIQNHRGTLPVPVPVLVSRLNPGGDHRRGIPGVREKHCISVAMEMKISTITIVFCFKASKSSVLTPSPTLPLLQICPSNIPAYLTDYWARNWKGSGRTHKNMKSGQEPEKEKKVREGLVERGDDKIKLEKEKKI